MINENYHSFIDAQPFQRNNRHFRLRSTMQQSINITLKDIHSVNEALLVLRHFIDLSARLLPFLDELQRKEAPTEQEQYDKQRIISVYKNYHFDTKTSEVLINSNILELINESFQTLSECRTSEQYQVAQRKLVAFILEHKRLSDKWSFIHAN